MITLKIKKLDITKMLEEATKDFFPEDGSWKSSCFKKSEDSWLCHLRDNNWLAKKLQDSKNLNHIPFEKILNFVKTSYFFEEKRHDYEQKVVKWQIEWMMNGGGNWIVPEGYSDDFISFDENYDIGFRKGIVKTLTAVGMDVDAIEEGIEKNVDLWLDIVMNSAFRNRYEPIFIMMHYNMEQADSEHREKWLRIRRYEYYKNHMDSVNKYGNITPDMKISEEEAAELYSYLIVKDEERRKYLKQLEQTERIEDEFSKTLIKMLNENMFI